MSDNLYQDHVLHLRKMAARFEMEAPPVSLEPSRFWPVETWEERQERFRKYAATASKREVDSLPVAPIAV